MGKTVIRTVQATPEKNLCPSTPERVVPDTHAYTHDGQRQVPRDRPDIRTHLTGSFTHVAQRFMRGNASPLHS